MPKAILLVTLLILSISCRLNSPKNGNNENEMIQGDFQKEDRAQYIPSDSIFGVNKELNLENAQINPMISEREADPKDLPSKKKINKKLMGNRKNFI